MTNNYGEINGDVLTTDSGSVTISATDNTVDIPYAWKTISGSVTRVIESKKGGDDMRYLYEVILVNPKNDQYFRTEVVAKSETSALMTAYDNSKKHFCNIDFDDLKTSCRVLMEWKKEKSLKKAIETIKEAVE